MNLSYSDFVDNIKNEKRNISIVNEIKPQEKNESSDLIINIAKDSKNNDIIISTINKDSEKESRIIDSVEINSTKSEEILNTVELESSKSDIIIDNNIVVNDKTITDLPYKINDQNKYGNTIDNVEINSTKEDSNIQTLLKEPEKIAEELTNAKFKNSKEAVEFENNIIDGNKDSFQFVQNDFTDNKIGEIFSDNILDNGKIESKISDNLVESNKLGITFSDNLVESNKLGITFSDNILDNGKIENIITENNENQSFSNLSKLSNLNKAQEISANINSGIKSPIPDYYINKSQEVIEDVGNIPIINDNILQANKSSDVISSSYDNGRFIIDSTASIYQSKIGNKIDSNYDNGQFIINSDISTGQSKSNGVFFELKAKTSTDKGILPKIN